MLLEKNFKRHVNFNFLLPIFFLFYSTCYSQTIPSTGFFGINGWMSDNIGQSGDPGPTLTPPIVINPSGDLYTIMGFPGNTNPGNVVQTLGIKFMRYGGITVDINFPTFDPSGTTDMQFERFVKAARSIGAEPIIQVPFLWQWFQTGMSSLTAGQVASDATYLAKVAALVTRLKASPFNVKYWSIGNEPDRYHLAPFTRNGGTALTATDIKNYFTVISDKIRSVDLNAIIVGPDLSESQAYSSGGLADQLITGTSKISGNSTTYTTKKYVDIWAYHYYPYNGSQSRPTVIANPSNGFAGALTNLRSYIGASGSGNTNLPIAVTEMNISHDNDGPNTPGTDPNGVGDMNCNSFLAGQWMAEMFAVGLAPTSSPAKVAFMVPWSVHESSGNAGEADFGILNGTSHLPRSTYHHIKMLATHFNAYDDFIMGSTNGDGNLKAFSARNCGQIAVMIMNQYQTTKTIDVSFTNSYPTSGSNKIKLNIGNALPFQVTIAGEESRLLLFDPCGRLRDSIVYNKTIASSNGNPSTAPQSVYKSCRCIKTSTLSNPILRCAVSTETGSVHYNNLTLSTDKTIADSAYITGTLVVPNRLTLTINSAEVSLGAGAKIVVQDGGTLTISNSTLHACSSDARWGGIRVTGSNSGDQLSVYQSYILDSDTAIYTTQVNNISVTESVFENGNVAILMRKSQGFNVSSNEFTGDSKCIQTIESDSVASYIRENLFYEPDTALRCTNDLHKYLDITCNAFVDYKAYGIYATGGLLKDQGTPSNGPGNQFVTNSTETNHQLYFDGYYGMTYYCDNSEQFGLSLHTPYTATASVADGDGDCETIEGRLMNHNINKENFASSRRASRLINCVPNPSSDKTTFNYTLENNVKTGEIRITNLFGEIVNLLYLSPDSKSVDAIVSSYKNGIYFYSLYVNGTMVDSKKLVISK